MASDVVASNSIPTVRNGWAWRIAVVAILVALADWLFFRKVVGVSLALFVLAVGAGVVLANRLEASRREVMLYCGILIAAVLPGIEHFNIMSVLIAACGICIFALGVTAALRGSLVQNTAAIGWFAVSSPFQVLRDLPAVHAWVRQYGVPVNFTLAKGWVVPLVFGAVFIALFAAANPLIANWLSFWNFGDALRRIDIPRVIFWGFAMVAVWAFVCIRGRFALPDHDELVAAAKADLPALETPGTLFNDSVILRSLVLFNLLFAVQSALDIHYLWRGAELPDGMTYASYAHRGAYPLIATALLAALFVIVSMRPGSNAERSPVMRALVFLWVGQNVLLVLSSMLRLDLYVEVYLLTYWRVAAFIWMLMVAAGLVLIVVRIVTYRSNAWLVTANAIVLALTIYACSFVNFANLVASYNVSRSLSANASRPIDLGYVIGLGPQAVPALDRYLAAHPQSDLSYFRSRRDQLAAAHVLGTVDWRAWTFRRWRLTCYLARCWPDQP